MAPTIRILSRFAAMAAFSFTTPCFAQQYPVVFSSAAAMRPLGIDGGYGSSSSLEYKCFYYGDGSYMISFSDQFLSRFRRRGFTKETLCLGLVSNTRFDPETGRRLPTYIVANERMIAEDKRAYGEVVSAGAVTDELPLDLPDCFKNGRPYSDCGFYYGRKSGKALSSQETQIYAQLGNAFDRASGRLKQPAEARADVKGFTVATGYYLPADLGGENVIDEKLLRYSSASIWILSPKLERKYAYGLDADGAAGPSVSPEAILRAEQPVKPQVNVQDLIRILISESR